MAPYQIIKRFEPAGKPSVCIIAVQGLWADPNHTWANNGVNWLQGLLPVDLPTARIMSFEPVKDPRSSPLKQNRRSVVSLCAMLRTAALSLAETPATELEDEALQLTFCIQQQRQKDVRYYSDFAR